MTPNELVLKGIEVIERDGWHQGGMFREPRATAYDSSEEWEVDCSVAARTAPVCVVGSLYRALYGTCRAEDIETGVRNRNTDLLALAHFLISAELGGRAFEVPHFNDNPSTSLEDVILVMKRAAADKGE